MQLSLEANYLSPCVRDGRGCVFLASSERLTNLLPEDLIHAGNDDVVVGDVEGRAFQSLSSNINC